MLDLTSRTNTYGLRGRALRYSITLTSVIGFSLFGYNQGMMSGLITGREFNYAFPATAGTDHWTEVHQGAVTACYELGCLFGALFVMVFGEKFGRRPCIAIGASIIVVGTVISFLSFRDHIGLLQFVIGRVTTGIGNGMNTATIPVYQSEMTTPEKRGQLVTLEGCVVALGTCIAYWVDYGFSFVPNSAQWRVPVALQVVFAAIVLVGIIGLPESPRWLVNRGREQEAEYIMSCLYKAEPTDQFVVEQMDGMMLDKEKSSRHFALSEFFDKPDVNRYTMRALIGSSTQFFQQFTGCNAAIYYATVLFENSLGFDRDMALILGGVYATIYALSTIISIFSVERLGRRTLFLIGATGQGVAFTITFACLIDPTTENAKGAAFGLFFFIFIFAFTILPLPWVYPPEINPSRSRATASAISTCTNWLTNFAVVMFTPIFIGTSTWGCYLFFALFNYLWIPVIWFFYPETAGRSLEEIDVIFAKAYVEHKFPPWAAKDLPKNLTIQQIRDASIQCGLQSEEKEEVQPEDDYVSKISTSRSNSDQA